MLLTYCYQHGISTALAVHLRPTTNAEHAMQRQQPRGTFQHVRRPDPRFACPDFDDEQAAFAYFLHTRDSRAAQALMRMVQPGRRPTA